MDSSVVAALLHRAIGDQLTCVFVDNGLLRLGEGDQVMATFARHMGVKVIRVDAEERFLGRARGRRRTRSRSARSSAAPSSRSSTRRPAELTDVSWLAQGTIYPDVIESAGAKTGKAKVIKSHHNVGGLPENMKLKLVEPLRELFKDEVRRIGVELGLPREMVYRHPFPGPGPRRAHPGRGAAANMPRPCARPTTSSSRSCAAPTSTTRSPRPSPSSCRCARSAWWATTGSYAYVIALRAVETIDFMTARWAHLPYEFLDLVSPAHRQRGPRRLPRGLRHHRQAAGHHRVGVNSLNVTLEY